MKELKEYIEEEIKEAKEVILDPEFSINIRVGYQIRITAFTDILNKISELEG